MGSHDPFGYLKHKLWSNERSEVKLPQPLKVGNRPDLLACRWHGTYFWKALDKGYNFASKLISIKGLHKKLWASKVTKVPRQNDIWVLVPWLGIKNIIRGKVVASLKSGP